jgi:branched-chain amino acid transport system substrate-binding protein
MITCHRAVGKDTTMMHFSAPFIVALGTAFGASVGHAEIRVGLAAALTGPLAWAGAGSQQGAEFAVADLNVKGGVLGEQIELIKADDYCEGEQAVAVANKLVADAVVAVFGHQCSGAAIPASKVYSQARLLLISTFATNPKLTEQGFTNVFRVVGRDDLQGRIASELLAERWGNDAIAIVHDGQAFGKGLAEETRSRLEERGITPAMYEVIQPGKADYWTLSRRCGPSVSRCSTTAVTSTRQG